MKWWLFLIGYPAILFGTYVSALSFSARSTADAERAMHVIKIMIFVLPPLTCIVVGIIAYKATTRWWHFLLGYPVILIVTFVCIFSMVHLLGSSEGTGLFLMMTVPFNVIASLLGWTLGSIIGLSASQPPSNSVGSLNGEPDIRQ